MRRARPLTAVLAILVSGCVSYGVVQNEPLHDPPAGKPYSLEHWTPSGTSDVNLTLTFSGGGTRAAAFSYGVLKALRETKVTIDGRERRLLNEVDFISSVSGGSFTAAYYGLFGERLFRDFETDFLRRDVEGDLKRMLFNPVNWFRSTSRTEWTIEYYDQNIFHGATFADMIQENHPLIVINATDLAYGVRFSFVQEYFRLLCSDLSSFSVARAVTASSAVPVVFPPVVVENYAQCGSEAPEWLAQLRNRATGNIRLTALADQLSTYFDKGKRKYIHFVDGGISDNLGLLAGYDIVEAAGGIRGFLRKTQRVRPRYVIWIEVDAATKPDSTMDRSTEKPTLRETITAMSDTQLRRYDVEVRQLMKQAIGERIKAVSTPDKPITAYPVRLMLADAAPEEREFFNSIPTSFVLSDEQVDRLIALGGELLEKNPEFQRFLSDVGQQAGARRVRREPK